MCDWQSNVHWDVLNEAFGRLDVAMSELGRPSTRLRPRLYQDGDQWCALYGEDLQVGLTGFGDTPAKAMDAFDDAYWGYLAKKEVPCKKDA